MAEAKPKKNNSKVFDVAKPGKSAPSATSKPVIITHRPVLQDPMVVNIEVTDDAKPLASPSEVRRKVQIVPLHDADGNDVAPGAPKVDATDKVTKKDSGAEGTLVLDLPPEVTGEKAKKAPATTAPELPDEKTESKSMKPTADEQPAPSQPQESEPSPEPETEPPAEEAAAPDVSKPEVKPTDDTPEPAEPESAPADVPETPVAPAEEVEADDASDFGLMPEPAMGDEGQANPDAVKQKAEEEAKKIADEQEKIIASGTYYLPIDAVAHRRAVHHTIIGIILVLVFGALLFLAALDAGILTINGFPAPTDYL